MRRIVVNSSAIIAALAGEAGGDTVRDALDEGAISSVNFAEVIAFFARQNHPRHAILSLLDPLKLEIVPFDAEMATAAGMLIAETRAAGLSLGDRACLALAGSRRARIMTADRAWMKVGTRLGFDILLIR